MPLASVSGFTANFTPTANPINRSIFVTGLTDGLDWTDPQTTGGQAVASAVPSPSRYSDDICHVKNSVFAFTPNQYAEAVVYKAPGYTADPNHEHELELLFRFGITPNSATGYELLWGIAGYLALVHWNGPVGNYTPVYDPGIGSAPIWNDGDVLRGELVGNLFTAKINGSIVTGFNNLDITAGGTIGEYTSGQCGVGFWPVDGAVITSAGWKSFTAGNL